MTACEVVTALPSYWQDINGLASRFGIETATEIIPVTGGCPAQYRVTWTGRVSALRKARLVLPSWRPPNCGRFVYPASAAGGAYRWPIIDAQIECKSGRFELQTTGGLPLKSAFHGGVEVLTYLDAIVYHGSREELIAQKLCGKVHFPGDNHRTKRSRAWFEHHGDPSRGWYTVRAPDGKYLFWTESDRGMLTRLEERLKYVEVYYPGNDEEIRTAQERVGRAKEALLLHRNVAFTGFMTRVLTGTGLMDVK